MGEGNYFSNFFYLSCELGLSMHFPLCSLIYAGNLQLQVHKTEPFVCHCKKQEHMFSAYTLLHDVGIRVA